MNVPVRLLLTSAALILLAVPLSAQNPKPPPGPPGELPTGLPPTTPGGPGRGAPAAPPGGPGGGLPPMTPGAPAGGLPPGPDADRASAERRGAPTTADGCVAADAGAAARDRQTHLAYARGKSGTALAEELARRLALVSDCPSTTHEALTSTFADVSVVIPKYVRDAECFGGDRGVLDRRRTAHERFAREQDHAELAKNLEWKTTAALNCIPPDEQAGYFADVAVEIAKAQESGTRR